jgi:hypothetical protein
MADDNLKPVLPEGIRRRRKLLLSDSSTISPSDHISLSCSILWASHKASAEMTIWPFPSLQRYDLVHLCMPSWVFRSRVRESIKAQLVHNSILHAKVPGLFYLWIDQDKLIYNVGVCPIRSYLIATENLYGSPDHHHQAQRNRRQSRERGKRILYWALQEIHNRINVVAQWNYQFSWAGRTVQYDSATSMTE